MRIIFVKLADYVDFIALVTVQGFDISTDRNIRNTCGLIARDIEEEGCSSVDPLQKSPLRSHLAICPECWLRCKHDADSSLRL